MHSPGLFADARLRWRRRDRWRKRSALRSAVIVVLTLLGIASAPTAASAHSVAAVSPRQGEINVFMRGSGGQLLWNHWTQRGGWTNWASLGGSLHPDTDIAAVSRQGPYMSVYVRWTDNRLFQLTYNEHNGGWGSWTDFGGVVTGGPTAASMNSNNEETFHRSTSGTIVQKSWNASSGWGNYVDLGECVRGGTGPAASSRAAGYIDLSFSGCDGQLWIKSYRPSPGWFPTYPKGGNLTTSPAMASRTDQGWNGRQDYLHRGTGGQIWQLAYDGSNFVGFTDLGAPAGGTAAGSTPATLWWRDVDGTLRQDIFVLGADGNVKQRTWFPWGWQGWATGLPPSSSQDPATFIERACAPQSFKPGTELGLSVGMQPSKIVNNPDRLRAFHNVMRCFRQITGLAPSIRVQMPIDAGRARPAGDPYDRVAEVHAFKTLLQSQGPGARGVVAIMSHDHEQCPANGPYAGTVRRELAGDTNVALASCEYPSPELYAKMLGEVDYQTSVTTGRNDLVYSAWNEPDHPFFKLFWAPVPNPNYPNLNLIDPTNEQRAANGSRLAGQYWAKAKQRFGASRVIAGDYSVSNAERVQKFIDGAGETPPEWATHPYGDMRGTNSSFTNTNEFRAQTGYRPLWLTEIGQQLFPGQPVIPRDQSYQAGSALRSFLINNPAKVFMYQLVALSGGAVESGLVDSQGRARPVLCGLAGIHGSVCKGSLTAGG